MTPSLDFFVPGIPKPAGSKRAFINKYTHQTMIVDASNNKDWRNAVTVSALAEMRKLGYYKPWEEPVLMGIIFYQRRPKHHYSTNGSIKNLFLHQHPTMAPDATKLLRCAEDAMNKIVYDDDSQVIFQMVRKAYGVTPGAHFILYRNAIISQLDLNSFSESFLSIYPVAIVRQETNAELPL